MAYDATKDEELEARFWAALRKDMTVMLGLGSEIEFRPMTANMTSKEDHGPVWFFTARSTELGRHLMDGAPKEAAFHFVSKGHDVWASVSGTMQVDMNRAVIDELWNPFVASWYEKGKDDPDLLLLRMDLAHGKIWKDGSSLIAFALTLLGRDPKRDYEDNVAEVNLR